MKNKNLYKYFLFIVTVSLFSCSDDLDVDNNNSSDPNVFQSPIERATELVFGAYSALQFAGATGGQAAIASAWFSEASVNPNNNSIPFSTAIGVTDGVYDATDDIAQQMYSDLYRIVNRANNTIETVDGFLRDRISEGLELNNDVDDSNNIEGILVNITDFDKTNFSEDEITTLTEDDNVRALAAVRGEALFLRSIALFWLSNTFNGGNVVMPLEVAENIEDTRLPLSSRATVFNQIIKDLTNVKDVYFKGLFQSGAINQGRATFGAAAALLGKVLLYDERFDEAAEVFKEVVDCAGCNYALVEDFESNFKEAGEFNPESVFEVQYADNLPFTPNFGDGEGTTTNESTIRAVYFGNQQGGFGWFRPSHFIVNLYKNELRTDADKSDQEEFYISTGGESVAKSGTTRNRLLSKRARASMAFADDGSLYYGRSTDSQDFTEGNFPTFPRRAVVRKFQNDDLRAELRASAINEKIIRYSDVLLMYAEALLRGSDGAGNMALAINQINEVRSARGLVSLESLFQGVETPPIVDLIFNSRLNSFPPDPSDLQSQEFPQNLLIREQDLTPENVVFHLFDKERPAEFAFEGRGILWNDLRRRPLRNSSSALTPALERLQELAEFDYELVTPNALDTSPGFIAFIRVNDNARNMFLRDFQRRVQNIQASFLRSNLYFPIPFIALNENPKLFDNPELLITD